MVTEWRFGEIPKSGISTSVIASYIGSLEDFLKRAGAEGKYIEHDVGRLLVCNVVIRQVHALLVGSELLPESGFFVLGSLRDAETIKIGLREIANHVDFLLMEQVG